MKREEEENMNKTSVEAADYDNLLSLRGKIISVSNKIDELRNSPVSQDNLSSIVDAEIALCRVYNELDSVTNEYKAALAEYVAKYK